VTAEPIREPDDEVPEEERRPDEERRPEDQGADVAPEDQSVPSADESLTGTATEPVTAPGESLTPEAAESAEAAAAAEADPNMDPNASEAAVAAADAQEVPTTAEAVATIDAATDAPAATATTDVPAEGREPRRAVVGRALRQLAVVVIGVTLLVAGIALGNYTFQTTRPAPTGGVGDPGGNLTNPPAAAQEFISALSINDADAIRSSLDRDPHLDLTREMTKYGIQRVDEIEVLGTTVDGPRSATEILMHYERDDGISFAINLVILVDGGKIEGFR
jgi:hypothetical protein